MFIGASVRSKATDAAEYTAMRHLFGYNFGDYYMAHWLSMKSISKLNSKDISCQLVH